MPIKSNIENDTSVKNLDATIILEFKTIGDNSIRGKLTYMNISPDMIYGKFVTIIAEECWILAFRDNLDYLLTLKPASLKIDIRRFI